MIKNRNVYIKHTTRLLEFRKKLANTFNCFQDDAQPELKITHDRKRIGFLNTFSLFQDQIGRILTFPRRFCRIVGSLPTRQLSSRAVNHHSEGC